MTCPDCSGPVEQSLLRDPAGSEAVKVWDCARCQRTGFVTGFADCGPVLPDDLRRDLDRAARGQRVSAAAR